MLPYDLIIDLLPDQASKEQLKSECKSDMRLERLPNGMFNTNFLACTLAAVEVCILPWMRLSAFLGK